MRGVVSTVVAIWSVALAAFAQTPIAHLHDLLKAARPLTRGETRQILTATNRQIAGAAFRWSTDYDDRRGQRGSTEVVIGANSRPHFIRMQLSYEAGFVSTAVPGGEPASSRWHVDADHIVEFTGRRVRACGGAARPGELIVEYTNEGGGWTAVGIDRPYPGYPHEIFDILAGAIRVESGDVQRISDRVARAFLAPWMLPTAAAQSTRAEAIIGDPLPNVPRDTRVEPARQALWIDVDSLRPVRWEAFPDSSRRAGAAQPFRRFTFDYDATLTIDRPAGIAAPGCVG